VAFVVYVAVQTRLLTAIYTIKYNLVACRLDYNLAPSGSTSAAQLSLLPSNLFLTKEKVVSPHNIHLSQNNYTLHFLRFSLLFLGKSVTLRS
jgi:hypothetical protein